jgi:hypothetical protein
VKGLVMMALMAVDQKYLNYYFGNIWHTNSNPCIQNEKSGMLLLDKIGLEDEVIDVGCGTNPFKGLIKNLIGIDPAFDQADVKCGIDEFETDKKFDVALCLGSINFGDVTVIERQITKVVSLLKPTARIYWRCNPGQQDHPSKECENINFYTWSIDEHIRLANKFGFNLNECCWENNNRRIYAEWIR